MPRPAPPLDGVLVVDFSRVLAGPFCTMQLGDMGARVLKIEPPAGDDTRKWGPPFAGGESTYYLSVNRNKESIVVDLRREEGRAIVHRFLERADVVVENFRPGTLARWGFGYDDVHTRYSRIVYASVSGYGQTGPRAREAGYDLIAQGEGGVMSLTGPPDGLPYKLGASQADLVAGWLAVQGILLALLARARTGEGQHVDVSLLDGQIALLAYHVTSAGVTGASPDRLGNAHPSVAPYDVMETADGHVTLGVGTDAMWRSLCGILHEEAWAEDPRFATNAARVAHRIEVTRALGAPFRSRTTAEWLVLLRGAGIPCGPVQRVLEALDDPQVLERGMVARIEHRTAGSIVAPGIPVHLSATPGSIRRPPPLMGEHTDDLLREFCSFSDTEIRALRASSTVA